MALRYWVGGSAAWDATAGSKWATSSGGVGGAAVPTNADDVFLDANSGAVTVAIQTAVATPGSVNCTGFTGTLSQATNINLGSATAGDFILGSGMTFVWISGAIKMSTTKASATTLDLAGKTVGSLTINAIGATIVFAGDITCGIFAPSGGSIDMNGHNMSCLMLSNGNTTTRTMNMRGGTITIRGTGTIFDTPAGALTYAWTAGAKFVISDTSATAKIFSGGTNATLPVIEIAGAASAGTVTFSGAFTCAGFIWDADSNVVYTISTTYTTLSITSSSTSGHNASIKSSSAGTPFTLSVASGVVSCNYLTLKDSTATGGAAFYAGSASSNVSGNSGWSFSSLFSQALTESVAVSDTLSIGKIALMTLSESIAMTDILARTLSRTLLESFTVSDGTVNFSPASIPNMDVWLDASQIVGLSNGDPVNTWADASGNSANATKGAFNAPTYLTNQLNGKPVVHFVAASSQALRATFTQIGGSSAPFTAFVVGRLTGGTNARVFGSIYPDNANWLLGWWNGQEAVAYYEGFIVGAGSPTTVFQQFTGKGDGSANGYLYQNGTLLGTAASHASMNGSVALSGYQSGGGTNELSDCEIAEVIIYHTALSDPDRLAVESYLSAKYFGGGSPPTRTVLIQLNRHLTETITMSDSLLKQINKTLSESFSVADTLVRNAFKVLSESILLSDTLLKRVGRTLSESFTVADTLTRTIGKIFSESITLADSLSRQATKVMRETITMTDSLLRQLSRTFTESISISDVLTKASLYGRTLVESIAITDTLSRTVIYFLTLTEVVTFTDTVFAYLLPPLKRFALLFLYPIRVIIKLSKKAATLTQPSRSAVLRLPKKPATLSDTDKSADVKLDI